MTLQHTIAEYVKENYTIISTHSLSPEITHIKMKVWPPSPHTHDLLIYADITVCRGFKIFKIFPHSDPNYFQLLHDTINEQRPSNKKFVKDVDKYISRREKGK